MQVPKNRLLFYCVMGFLIHFIILVITSWLFSLPNPRVRQAENANAMSPVHQCIDVHKT